MAGPVGYRPNASRISSVVVFLPTFLTKSEATTMPTSLLSFSTGSRLILLVDITRAASLSEVSGLTVMSVLVMTSVTFRSKGCSFRHNAVDYVSFSYYSHGERFDDYD